MVTLHLAAKNHKEFWTDVYKTYSKDPKKASSVALAKQLRKVIADLKVLEQMG
jgi:hypothetical protein